MNALSSRTNVRDLPKAHESHKELNVTLPSTVRLDSFVSRLSCRYLAAQPSMSLVPLAPFLAPLGMTMLWCFSSHRSSFNLHPFFR